MIAFELALPGRISFGPGAVSRLPRIVADLGSRALVLTGATPSRVSPSVDGIRAAVAAVALHPIAQEPDIGDARAAVARGEDLEADIVVAIGGGSVIDLAKAAAMLLANGGDPLDYIEVVGRGQPITRPALPVVAVPTTSGTGAEVTANAVLSVPEHHVKASLRHPLMLPRHAVVDPELTLTCPPGVTAASGMDALTQCLEPFVSVRANPVTDAWALAGLQHAGGSVRTAFTDGSDLSARTGMALASLLGGLSLANAKLGAVHGFAGVVGGMSGAPHGEICAALLAPVCRANLTRADDGLAARFTQVARALTGDPRASAADGIAWIEDTCRLLQVRSLGDLGLTPDQAPTVAVGAARASSTAGNPVHLSEAELTDVFLAAL